MSRFRLRYGSTDLELSPGEFVVGRSTQCSLALDDALVSRRHASFHVTDSSVELQDLGSRNGVAVNGEKVKGRRKLQHLDRVQIGSQEILLLKQNENRSAATLQLQACPHCGHLNDTDATHCGGCNRPLGLGTRTLTGTRATREMMLEDDAPEETTAVGSSFHLIKAIADKALAMGRYDEAERILGPSLKRLRTASSGDGRIFDSTRKDAVDLVLRLCEGPDGERWLTWLFELHTELQEVLEKDAIATLHKSVRKMKSPSSAPLENYLDALDGKALSPSEAFRVKQLEGLLRVIQA
ncbi:MAG: FHA domain-containing protein [Myxococcota bacterium]